jgi:taurine dioxygenase
LKERLAPCHAKHLYYSGTVQKNQSTGRYSGDTVHPVFVSHDETHRDAIFVNRLITDAIVELPEAESDAVLEQLFDHCENPGLIYEHIWAPKDFVMWDNRCVNHARTDFAETERRLLRRTVIQGLKPTPTKMAVSPDA